MNIVPSSKMNSYTWILVFAFCSIWNVNFHADAQIKKFVVTEFGAVADGITDSKEAFGNAWKNACETPGGAVSVPAGSTFLLSGADFFGPCNGITRFQIEGTLVASGDIQESGNLHYWISFGNVDHLRIIGRGVFDGNGASSWSKCDSDSESNCDGRPTSLSFYKVRGVVIRGITSRNSKMFHMTIHRAENVVVRDVTITAPADSPNTDGIHLMSSSNVWIANSVIGTGDDCVSLGDGSRNVTITGVACGPGHGISIGSLGKYNEEEDVSGITVNNCSLKGTTNGVRIKTWAPSKSSTLVSGVNFSDITMTDVDNPIIIDQHYCPHGGCQTSGESSVQIKGVKFINIQGSSAKETGIDVQCSKTVPCQDVQFVQVDLAFNQGGPTIANCSNVNGQFQQSNPSHCSTS